MTEEEKKALNE
jgi:hypothetical protein